MEQQIINQQTLDWIAPVNEVEREAESIDIDRIIAEIQAEANEKGQYYTL